MKKCIYCNKTENLSDSDIIPDALTNAKVRNKNVCKVEHNNKFSDLFEWKVIQSLSFITNELDIKSSKAKNHVPYTATVKIDDIEYTKDISSAYKVFDNRIVNGSDGKSRIGPLEKIQKIAIDKGATQEEVEIINPNECGFELNINFSTSIFIADEMYRLVSKIAYEWYCLVNEIDGYHSCFSNIVQFITLGEGENPAKILNNIEIYDCISARCEYGSHVLYTHYDEQTNYIYVIVSLFGMSIYSVKVCEASNMCKQICAYHEFMLDGQHRKVIFDSLKSLSHALNQSFFPVKKNGITYMLPFDMNDTSLKNKVAAELLMITTKQCLQNHSTISVHKIIFDRYDDIINTSTLNRMSLRRFVKDIFGDFSKPININPNATDFKQIFLMFVIFIIGKKSPIILNNQLLNEIVKQRLGESSKYVLNENLCQRLHQEIITTTDYYKTLELGAREVMKWE